MPRIVAHGLTDIGRRRKQNEDAYRVEEALGLFVVADGLGGHAAGEVASNEAVDVIVGWIRRERAALDALAKRPEDGDAQLEVQHIAERAIAAATYHVHGMAMYDAGKAGMGTTVSLMVLAGDVAVIAQVGDSRIYRVRNGVTTQLTDDHTLVAMQIRDGLLTPDEAKRAPFRNVITRAVGSHEYVQVDTRSVAIVQGDAYLLCTDGLHGYVTVEEIAPLLADDAPPIVTQRLIDLANQRGGKDNITAIVARVS